MLDGISSMNFRYKHWNSCTIAQVLLTELIFHFYLFGLCELPVKYEKYRIHDGCGDGYLLQKETSCCKKDAQVLGMPDVGIDSVRN
jgi:hypothetical protein